jgi:glycine/D-amino acid oxidase-like deaminating enzyme/nitrite reductase/ring-hydroxylating ferredoxin subunit
MESLWLATAPSIRTDPFEPGAGFDEVVVGAGLTGLVTALLLGRAGRRVAVLEARRVGAVTSGNTTAKLSQLQGLHLQKVLRATYPAVMRAYADSQRAAFDWMTGYLDERGVPYERRAAVTYATTPEGAQRVAREHELARMAGLPTTMDYDPNLPFPTTAAVAMLDQVQFDPMQVLAALAAEIRATGGRIFEGARLTGLRASSPAIVRTTAGELAAGHVVLATGTPVLDRGLYFAKVAAHRSYAMAFRVPQQLPHAMYLNAESPTRSIRTHGDLLLTGGNGHHTGRHPSPARAMRELELWTGERWPGAELEYSWAAQDYLTPHHVPFVGFMPRGRRRILLATGFEKWGMTNAVATAMTIVADLFGGHTDWQRTLRHRATLPIAFAHGVGENAAVGWWYARSWARSLSRPLPQTVADGTGAVGRTGLRPTGISTIDGVTCRVSGICTHLGAALSWNDGERSWDCPAHGSRFAPDGAVLEGPAKHPLRSVQPRRS